MANTSAFEIEKQKVDLKLELKSQGINALISRILQQDAQIERLTEQLQQQNQNILVLQGVVDAISGLEILEPDSFVEDIAIDAESALRGDHGFYALEYDKRGLAFRWTGPDRAFRFNLHLLRDVERTLTLNLLNFSLKASRDVTGWVNGHRIDWAEVEKKGEYTSYTFRLPPLKDGKVATNLIFEAPATFSPQEQNPASKDSRTLGVAFYSLTSS